MSLLPRGLAAFTAALTAASLLASREAGATSPPCEPFAVLGSNVAAGATSVPRDVRLVVGYSACGAKADVVLLRDGIPVDAEITHGVSVLQGGWASVKPRAALDASAPYSLRVKSELGSSTIGFTTGDGLASRNDARPSVTVISSAFASPANTAGVAAATFEVEMRPAAPMLGGVLFLDKQSNKEFFDFSASAFAFDRGEPSARVTIHRGVRAGEPTCFSAVYEDEGGRASVASEPTCATVAGAPPPAAATPAPANGSDAGGSGCSSSPHRSDAPWAAAMGVFVFALARRSRRRGRASAVLDRRGAPV